MAVQHLQNGKRQNGTHDSDIASMLVTINEKLDSLILLRDTVTNIERSIQHLSDKYDEASGKDGSARRQDNGTKNAS